MEIRGRTGSAYDARAPCGGSASRLRWGRHLGCRVSHLFCLLHLPTTSSRGISHGNDNDDRVHYTLKAFNSTLHGLKQVAAAHLYADVLEDPVVLLVSEIYQIFISIGVDCFQKNDQNNSTVNIFGWGNGVFRRIVGLELPNVVDSYILPSYLTSMYSA